MREAYRKLYQTTVLDYLDSLERNNQMSFTTMGPVQVQQRQSVAHAQTIDGRQITVNRLLFSAPMPGVGSEGFAVDIGAGQTAGQTSVGFANYDDAMRFITSADSEKFTVVDGFGNTYEETRVGLGVPDGMIRESEGAKSLRTAPAVPTVVPPPAPTHPVTAAALNAPPDAADAPHGNTSGENAELGRTRDARFIEGTPVESTVARDSVDNTGNAPRGDSTEDSAAVNTGDRASGAASELKAAIADADAKADQKNKNK
jgi:hypothetical protein